MTLKEPVPGDGFQEKLPLSSFWRNPCSRCLVVWVHGLPRLCAESDYCVLKFFNVLTWSHVKEAGDSGEPAGAHMRGWHLFVPVFGGSPHSCLTSTAGTCAHVTLTPAVWYSVQFLFSLMLEGCSYHHMTSLGLLLLQFWLKNWRYVIPYLWAPTLSFCRCRLKLEFNHILFCRFSDNLFSLKPSNATNNFFFPLPQ